MGYRRLNKPPKPENMLLRLPVRNGATLRTTFGCYYSVRGHDPHYHDYINWPSHDYHPGAICQMWPPRDRVRWSDGCIYESPAHLDPIHLQEEGYTDLAIAFDDSEIAEHLIATLSFDQEKDNYIRLSVATDLPLFEDKPKETRFTIFVKKEDGTAVDAVCHGIITILPGSPYPSA